MAYAQNTEVSFDRSVAEIVALLRKAGANQIAQAESRDRFQIRFAMTGRQVQFRVNFLTAAELAARTGPRQDPRRVDEQWRRQRARALLLVIKAKLEAIDSEVETFEQSFLPHIVLANGETVHERIAGPIAREYETGAVQPSSTLFLSGPGGRG